MSTFAVAPLRAQAAGQTPPRDADAPAPASRSPQGGLLGGAPAPDPPAERSSESARQLQLDTLASSSGRGPTVVAPRVSTVPVLDGRLDDDAWAEAARITRFVQRSPVEGAPATEDTEVLVAFDSANLYFGFYVHYSDPQLVRANRTDRDQFAQDDTISIYFDPFLDQQRAYVFTVNGYGVQGDSMLGGGGGGGGFGGGGGGGPAGIPRGDPSWDALFYTSGALVSDGWTAEVTIPFKSLRYPASGNEEARRWGFQIARTIGGKNEAVVWAPVSRAIAGFMTQMGTLEGLTNLSTSRNLEILPTFTAIRVGTLDSATGSFEQGDLNPEAGVNVKYGVTSDLIADFTFNPDFSQIESDQPQIEVNQRFPLFFPELRPFFLEGREVFDTSGTVNLVHTRTIVDPRYGGKLTGKIGPTTLGLLVANDQAPGKVDDPADPAFDQSARFFIGRLRYDFAPGSYVGALVTDGAFLDAYSRVGAVDGRLRLGQTDDVDFRLARSWRRDEAGVEHAAATYDVGLRHNGRNLDYNLDHAGVAPDFGTVTGFVRRTDTRRTRGRAAYRWWPESWIVNWGSDVTYLRNYDYAGVLQDEGIGIGGGIQFASNIRLNASLDREMERFNEVDFRKWRRRISGQIGTSRRISLGGEFSWGDQVRYADDAFLGRSREGRLSVNLRPFSRLRSDLDFDYSRLVDPRDGREVFSVTILRALTTYQFTERLLIRNILEHDTLDRTLDTNVLVTYRVNAGTVFFIGYDDAYQQGNRLDATLFPTDAYQRTNRAFFTKLSYLFRS